MTSFINVGNSKNNFERFFNIIKKYFKEIPKPIHIQYGYSNIKKEEFVDKDIFLYRFLEYEKYQELSENCELFISHGGVGSIQTALSKNKFPIVIPRLKEYGEIINNHQLEICKRLQNQKKILLVLSEIDFEKKLKIFKIRDYKINNNFLGKEKLITEIRNCLLNYENINQSETNN